MFNSESIKKNLSGSIDHLVNELKTVRAGRANPDMVKHIKVEAYGSMMPIEQLANINVADPTLLVVQPWDKTLIGAISKAIQSENIGINPAIDGEIIRLPIPPLTSERRQEYVKMVKQKAEDAKISIRQKRKDALMELDQEKSKGMSEDDYKRHEKELQNIVDEMNKKIESLASEKEKELLQV